MAKREKNDDQKCGPASFNEGFTFDDTLKGAPCDPYAEMSRCQEGHDREKAYMEYCAKARDGGTEYCESTGSLSRAAGSDICSLVEHPEELWREVDRRVIGLRRIATPSQHLFSYQSHAPLSSMHSQRAHLKIGCFGAVSAGVSRQARHRSPGRSMKARQTGDAQWCTCDEACIVHS